MPASSLGSEFREGVIHVVPAPDGIIAVCLEGEFDLANAPALDDQTQQALENATGLIVDLSEATFIDSSIIGVLIQAAKNAAARDKTVVLQLGTAPIVERIIEIVGIERTIPCAHDRQNAVGIIQQQQDAETGEAGLFRSMNESIAALALEFGDGPETNPWSFHCECGACHDWVDLPLRDLQALRASDEPRVLASGHRVTEARAPRKRARELPEQAQALRAQAQH